VQLNDSKQILVMQSKRGINPAREYLNSLACLLVFQKNQFARFCPNLAEQLAFREDYPLAD
jgi:hypothetical protein